MIDLEGYRVEKRIGSTIQSDVYAGVDLDGDVPVVIKVYKRPCASVEVSRANREFQLLRELANARGVPRPVEVALVGSNPAIVTKRCRGVPLASYLQEIPRPSIDVGAFLAIATRLAETLTDVHEHKIVHKDVCPQNVVVDPATLETTLVDFGIASKLGRAQSYHDAPTEGGGNWIYSAPEQSGRLDRGIDFRTDLYSLGALLYEVLTGRPPFEASDPIELILSHLTRLPRPPTAIDATIPETLSQLVLKLLAKDPDERYQRAQGVHHDLALCRHQWESSRQISRDLRLARHDGPLRVRFPSELFGREAEQALLREALARASDGHPQLALVAGPSGIGKTALVATLRDAVHDHGGHVIWAKFDLAGSKRPYRALSSALERWVSQVLIGSEAHVAAWREKLERALGNLASVLPELAPDFRIFIGESPPLAPLDARRTRDRLAAAFERLVAGLATREHPLVLVLDDVQWIDDETLALVRCLAREQAGAALMLVCTHRGRETPRAMREAVAELGEAGFEVRNVELGPLSDADTTTLLASALERDAASAARLGAVLGHKTDNNPFLIRRLVESLVDSEHIRFDGEVGWVWDEAEIAGAAIPDDVGALLAQRVQNLPPELRSVITFASCIGDEFELDLLARLSPDPRPKIELALYALGDRGLITPCHAGFRFVHDRVREAADAGLTEHERQTLHSDIAHLLLERTAPADVAGQVFAIVEHFGRAVALVEPELRIRVLDLHLMAAERALAGGAAETARRYLATARELHRAADWEDHGERSFNLLISSANAARHAYDNDAAMSFLDELLRHPLDERQRGLVGHLRIATEETRSSARAVEVALEELARTGVRWPRRPTLLQTWRAVARAEWRLWFRRPPLLRPKPRHMPSEILARLLLLPSASATFTAMNSRLACFAAAEGVWAMAKYGIPGNAAYALAGLGGQRFIVTRNPRTSLRLSTDVREALADTTESQSSLAGMTYRVTYILAMLIDVWTKPRMKVLSVLPTVVKQAIEAGDHTWGLVAAYRHAYYQALSGVAVDACLENLRRYQGHLGSSGTFKQDVLLSAALVEILQSGERVADVCPLSSERPPARAVWPGIQQSTLAMQVACIMGEFEWAFEESEIVDDEPLLCPHTTYIVDYCLFRGLAAAALATHPARLRRARTITRKMHRWLRACARHGPDFVGPAHFIAAERARLRGQTARALALYAACQERSLASGYVHHAALALEREASLLHALHRDDLARERTDRAIGLYAEWGATAKAQALEASRNPRATASSARPDDPPKP